MKKISFNILYWDGFDSENRLKNVKFCWNRMKKFSEYANVNGIEIKTFLFDFSENKTIEDSIHIPYKNGEYKKSEKMNKVIEYNHNNYSPDIFCCLDSDIFFNESEFNKLIDELNNFDPNSMTICCVLDIQNSNNVNYENNSLFPGNISVRLRYMAGLGAFYMIDFNNLFNIGGFDERFICWGGEDDDAGERLNRIGIKKKYTTVQLFHLPHESLCNDSMRSDQYKEQCKIIGHNDIVTKHSLITKKYFNNGTFL